MQKQQKSITFASQIVKTYPHEKNISTLGKKA
jgi:hypothetical protein